MGYTPIHKFFLNFDDAQSSVLKFTVKMILLTVLF